jgi:tetratricopeptide (TPR) repeat protein
MDQRVESSALRRYVVRVQSLAGDVLGTGFWVAPGRALTCAHVVGDHSRVHLVPADDLAAAPTMATVLAHTERPADADQVPWPFPDLAVLGVEGGLNHPCPPLLAADPVGDQTCHAFGFPPRQSGRPVGSPRTFDYEGRDGDGYLLLKKGQSAPGISGAPLLCPSRRAIVGVVGVSRNSTTDLHAWASPLDALLTGNFAIAGELADVGREIQQRNPIAAVADRMTWQRVLPIDPANTPEPVWADFVRGAKSKPSELLLAGFRVVPYLFRGSELDAAQKWCDSAEPFSILTVPGVGGAGKTRFAVEVCRQMISLGWVAQFWHRGDATPITFAPQLVVIDYAEDVGTEALRHLIAELRQHSTAMTPTRLLLLATDRGGRRVDLLDDLRRGASPSILRVLHDAAHSEAAAASLSLEQSQALYAQAFRRFQRAWYPMATDEPAPAAVDLSDPRYATALDVLFEAFDCALAAENTTDRPGRGLVERILDHEQRYWRQTAPDGLTVEQMRLAVTLATLCGADTDEDAESLMTLVHGGDADLSSIRASTRNWVAGLYEGPGRLNPLRPDRLGEALIRDVLCGQDGVGRGLLTAVFDCASDGQLERTLEILTRLASSDAAMRGLSAEAAGAAHYTLVSRAAKQASGTVDRPARAALAVNAARLIAGPVAEDLVAMAPDNAAHRRGLSLSCARLADLAHASGSSGEAERLHRQALAIAEDLVARAPDNPVYRRDLSLACGRVADLAGANGDSGEAEHLHRQALTIAEDLVARAPDNPVYRRGLSLCCGRLADLAHASGNIDEAEHLHRQALIIAEDLVALAPDNAEYRRDLSLSYARLADLAGANGNSDEAEHLHRQALDIAEDLVARAPDNPDYRRGLSLCYGRLADLAHANGDSGEAQDLHRQALTIAEDLVALAPDNPIYRRGLSLCYGRLADVAHSNGDSGEAEDLYRQALTIAEDLVALGPDNPVYRRDLSLCYGRLADVARDSGHSGEAEDLYRHALAITEDLVSRAPDNFDYRRGLSLCYGRLADLARDSGQSGEAEHLHRQALAIREDLVARAPDNPVYRRDLSLCYSRLADLARDSGNGGEAEHLHRQALTIAEDLVALVPDNPDYRRDLSLCYGRLADLAADSGNSGKAELLNRQALAIREDLVTMDPDNLDHRRDLSRSYTRLADLARASGNSGKAETMHRQALAIREELVTLDPDNPDYRRDLSIAYERLADLARAGGNSDEAERLNRQALSIREGLVTVDPGNPDHRGDLSIAYERLADLARAGGNSDEAERLNRQALTIREGLVTLDPGNPDHRRDLAITYERLVALAPNNPDYRRDLSITYEGLADLAHDSGNADEAERLYRQALAIREDLVALAPDNPDYRRDLSIAYERLADLAHACGNTGEATD